MKNFLICISLLTSICLSTKLCAQSPYTFVLKNIVCPYDSGVVVEIKEYRKIRFAHTIADSLIASLHIEINESLHMIIEQDKNNSVLLNLVAAHAKTITEKNETIAQLRKTFDDLATEAKRPKKWYQTNAFKISVGVVAGIAITKL